MLPRQCEQGRYSCSNSPGNIVIYLQRNCADLHGHSPHLCLNQETGTKSPGALKSNPRESRKWCKCSCRHTYTHRCARLKLWTACESFYQQRCMIIAPACARTLTCVSAISKCSSSSASTIICAPVSPWTKISPTLPRTTPGRVGASCALFE